MITASASPIARRAASGLLGSGSGCMGSSPGCEQGPHIGYRNHAITAIPVHGPPCPPRGASPAPIDRPLCRRDEALRLREETLALRKTVIARAALFGAE